MRYALFVAMMLAFSSQVTRAESLESMQSALDSAKTKSSQFYSDGKLPEGVATGAAQAGAARVSADVVNAPQFQKKVLAERERLQKEVYGISPELKPSYYAKAKNVGQTTRLASDERIYIFVSSSMPEATIRAYVQDVDQLHDPNIIFVLRGFVGGMKTFAPTVQFIANMLKKDRTCEGTDCLTYGPAFEIDPNLYRRYKPSQVPAVVFARDVTSRGPDTTEGIDENESFTAKNPWWMIYGDASLSYLFSRVAESANSSVLAAFSDVLKKEL